MSMNAYCRNTHVLFAVLFVGIAGGVSGESFTMSSLVVPKGAVQKNPTTEIAVSFGDVAHLSPWCVKRRFPRSVNERGGQLVTLREAMIAINETVAKDEEMPEHTFKFAKDESLVAICDIQIAASDGTASIKMCIDDAEDRAITPDLLAKPVRDFKRIEFVEKGKHGAMKKGHRDLSVSAGGVADFGGAHKTGDERVFTLPGGAKIEMIWCEPGTFMMGSPITEVGRFDDEPIHPVTLTKGFWLGKYEVTQAQWESVMGENRSRFKGADRPVENVSWDDCHRFVSKVNVAFGGLARMPTEAEWEYACRAGSTEPISGSGHLNDMAWYDRNSGSQTHAVGKNQANAWGFYDMHGNVLEWCADWFSRPEGQSIDPKGPPSGVFRVLRGGCWFFYERDCRSAYRLKRDPNIRNCIFGFRLACSGKGQD